MGMEMDVRTGGVIFLIGMVIDWVKTELFMVNLEVEDMVFVIFKQTDQN